MLGDRFGVQVLVDLQLRNFFGNERYSCTPAAARMYVQVLVDLQLRQKISVTRVMHQEAGCQSDLLCDTMRFYCRTRQCCLGPFDNTM
jgi:hypothetical protein